MRRNGSKLFHRRRDPGWPKISLVKRRNQANSDMLPTPVLRELHVKNLAVLAAASVELGEGLNVLTGETGAGKSIVVDSLLLLSGARADSDLIRTGAETLIVTGVFEPAGTAWRRVTDEAGIEPEGHELRRSAARNRVYVNDQPATARLLSDLAPFLLRIHGQREEMGLVDPELQRVWLDRVGGTEAEKLLATVEAAHQDWRRLRDRLDRLQGDERARRERLDLLRFQAREIDEAGLTAGEDEELKAERAVLRNRETITRALGASYDLLFDDQDAAVDRLGRAQSLLEDIAEWEPRAGEWMEELEELKVRVDELAGDLRRRFDGLEADPNRLNQVEDRLARVERLTRKYGTDVAGVLKHRRAVGEEIDELTEDEEGREELEAREEQARERYASVALELSAARREWGRELARRMEREIRDLGLAKARVEVALERRRLEGSPVEIDGEPVEAGPHGVDRVVYLFAANPGEDARPLARVASGGELSRLYLALQLATRGDEAARESSPTLVFDEADVGISGAQAAALGRKLQRLASGAQILAVTHLPQVVSHGHHHFRVTKVEEDGRTATTVRELTGEERVEEVARMLAGRRVTDLSLSHARELLDGVVDEEERAAS